VREGEWGSWEVLRNSFEIEDLHLRLLEQFPLSDGAASLICEPDDICREGDEVAHFASEGDIQSAILQQSTDSETRKKLERIFRLCYSKDV